jgi:hypothetical protein
VGGILVYLAFFAIPLLSVAAAVWLVVDSVRKFRRCRATRLA